MGTITEGRLKEGGREGGEEREGVAMILQIAAYLCLSVVVGPSMSSFVTVPRGRPPHAGPWQGETGHHERVQRIQEGHSHA